MEIIAVPSMGMGGLNEMMSARFGRCPSFTFVKVENGEIIEVKQIANPAAGAMGGAGIQATQFIADYGTTVALVGMLGPNAANSLNSLNIKIFNIQNSNITVKQAVELYLEGKLQQMQGANVGSHQGMGRGMGMGQGRGRGMGGRGRNNIF